jgi:hypothetical protein
MKISYELITMGNDVMELEKFCVKTKRLTVNTRTFFITLAVGGEMS